MEEIVKRLDLIEHQMKFFAEAYKHLHNNFISGLQVKLDKEALNIVLGDLKNQTNEFSNLYAQLNELIKKESIVGTLAFMAKRLHEIEESLRVIKEEGVKKKFHLDLTMNGQELVKKKPVAGNDISPEEHINNLLCVLSDRERTVILYHYGILDGKKYTYKEIAKKTNRSMDRISQIKKKALMKLKRPENEHLVKKITHMQLKFDILGEES